MAGLKNIKGITIEIGGDTTGLDKALKGVNTTIKTTQNELKDVNKALKLDPTNTELLEQKQRALAKTVSATAEKLKTLKETQKAAAEQLANKEIGQEQYDALTREIIKTESALKNAKKAAEEFNAGTAQMQASLDAVGNKAAEVAEKTKALSAAAAGVLVALGSMAYKSAQTADELNTLSQQTGLSTEELQKMSYAADIVDVSVDTISGSMSKMRKAMVSSSADTEEAFRRIGVSVRSADGSLRDSTEVFYDVLTGLSRVANETERDTLAMQIFGKSADQLAGVIDDGGAALKALGDEAEQMGLIMSQDTLDSLNAFNDQLDRLKAQATAEIVKAGASALEALSPVLEMIVSAISKVLSVIGSLNPEVIKIVAVVAAVIAAISPVASIISGITGAISKFLTILPQIKAGFAAVSAFAAANPFVLIAAGIVALVALIIANWDKIKPILDKVWETVKTVVEAIGALIKGAIDKVKATIENIKSFFVGIWDAIVETAKSKINAVIEFINKGIEAVNNFISKINNSGIGKFLGVNIGTIATIPALANGGVLQSGSALVGERGPELLTMRNGGAQVQPLATNTTTINNINNTNNRPVQIDLVCDGITLAKAMYNPLKQVSNQYGPSFVR